MPGLRQVVRCRRASTALAMPKSATIASPSCSMMFSGLMSRCTTPLAVGVVQRRGHLAGDAERVLERELRLAVQPLAQRLALDVRHDVVEQAAGLARSRTAAGCAGGCSRAAIWISRRNRSGPRFTASSGCSTLSATGRSCLQVLGQVDGRHAAAAELALDRVAVGEAVRRRSSRSAIEAIYAFSSSSSFFRVSATLCATSGGTCS